MARIVTPHMKGATPLKKRNKSGKVPYHTHGHCMLTEEDLHISDVEFSDMVQTPTVGALKEQQQRFNESKNERDESETKKKRSWLQHSLQQLQ